MSETEQVFIGETEVSLADLAGVDLTEVAEVRSLLIPAGKYHFRIMESELKAVEAANKEDPQGPKILKPVCAFELEAQNCFALVDAKLDPEDYTNSKHFETFWINDLKKDLGRIKAFLIDIGLEGNKPLTDLIAEAHAMEFIADISHAKNKDNPDRPWVNLKNLMTLEEFAESQGDDGAGNAAANAASGGNSKTGLGLKL